MYMKKQVLRNNRHLEYLEKLREECVLVPADRVCKNLKHYMKN